MHMAVENRGGFRPTAPQNNYAVSATGGSGNAGTQGAQAMTGGEYGDNQAMMELQTSAAMNASPTMPSSPSQGRSQRAPSGQQLTQLDAPTDRPDEPLTTGIDMDTDGSGSEVMYSNESTLNTEDRQRMIDALQTLVILAESPSASNAFRNYVRYLRGVL
jgi:hypothetical protein